MFSGEEKMNSGEDHQETNSLEREDIGIPTSCHSMSVQRENMETSQPTQLPQGERKEVLNRSSTERTTDVDTSQTENCTYTTVVRTKSTSANHTNDALAVDRNNNERESAKQANQSLSAERTNESHELDISTNGINEPRSANDVSADNRTNELRSAYDVSADNCINKPRSDDVSADNRINEPRSAKCTNISSPAEYTDEVISEDTTEFISAESDNEYRSAESNDEYISAGTFDEDESAPADHTDKFTAADCTDKFTPADCADEFTPADCTDEFTPADCTDEFTPADCTYEFTPADCTDEFTPADCTDEFTPAYCTDDYTPADCTDEFTLDCNDEYIPSEGSEKSKSASYSDRSENTSFKDVIRGLKSEGIKDKESTKVAGDERAFTKSCEIGASNVVKQKNDSSPSVDTVIEGSETDSENLKMKAKDESAHNISDEIASAGKQEKTKNVSNVVETVSHNGLGTGQATSRTQSKHTRKFKELLESGNYKEFVPASKSAQNNSNVDTESTHTISVGNNTENMSVGSNAETPSAEYNATTYSTIHPIFIPHSPIPQTPVLVTGYPASYSDSNLSPCIQGANVFALPEQQILQNALPTQNSLGVVQYSETSNSFNCNGNMGQALNTGSVPIQLIAAPATHFNYNAFPHTRIEQSQSLPSNISAQSADSIFPADCATRKTSDSPRNIPAMRAPNYTPVTGATTNILGTCQFTTVPSKDTPNTPARDTPRNSPAKGVLRNTGATQDPIHNTAAIGLPRNTAATNIHPIRNAPGTGPISNVPQKASSNTATANSMTISPAKNQTRNVAAKDTPSNNAKKIPAKSPNRNFRGNGRKNTRGNDTAKSEQVKSATNSPQRGATSGVKTTGTPSKDQPKGTPNNKPKEATSSGQPKGATSNGQTRGAKSFNQHQGATSSAQPQGATSGAQPQSATSGAQPQSATSSARPQGATSSAQPQGATSSAQPQGATSSAQPQGATSSAQPQGATSSAQPLGATSNAQPQGATSSAQPLGTTSSAQPLGATSNAQPSGATSSAQPIGATSNAQPRGATSSAQPRGAASNAQPRGAASSAQPRGAASSAQPRGAASSAQPRGAASSAQPRGAASSAQPRGATSSAQPRGGATSSAQPRGAANNAQPRGAANNAQPRGAASSAQPRGATSSAQPRGASSSAQPRGAASSAQPRGAASSAQPRGAASSAQPRGASSSAQPRGATSSAQPRGATSSAQPKGATSSAQPRGATSSAQPRGATSNGQTNDATQIDATNNIPAIVPPNNDVTDDVESKGNSREKVKTRKSSSEIKTSDSLAADRTSNESSNGTTCVLPISLPPTVSTTDNRPTKDQHNGHVGRDVPVQATASNAKATGTAISATNAPTGAGFVTTPYWVPAGNSTSIPLDDLIKRRKKEKKKDKRIRHRRTGEAYQAIQDFVQNIDAFNTSLKRSRDENNQEQVRLAFQNLTDNKKHWVASLGDNLLSPNIQLMRDTVENDFGSIELALHSNETSWRATLERITTLTLELKTTVLDYTERLAGLYRQAQEPPVEGAVMEEMAPENSDNSDRNEPVGASVHPPLLESRIADINHDSSNQDYVQTGNGDGSSDETSFTLPPFLRIEDKISKENVQGRRNKHRPRENQNTVQTEQPESVLHVTVHPSELNQRVNVSFRESGQLPHHPPIHNSTYRPSTSRETTASRCQGTRPLNVETQNNFLETNTRSTGPTITARTETSRSNVEMALEHSSQRWRDLAFYQLAQYIYANMNINPHLLTIPNTFLLNHIETSNHGQLNNYFQDVQMNRNLFQAYMFQQTIHNNQGWQHRNRWRSATTQVPAITDQLRESSNSIQSSTANDELIDAAVDLTDAVLSDRPLGSNMQLDGCASAIDNEGAVGSSQEEIPNEPESQDMSSEDDDFTLHISGLENNPAETRKCATIKMSKSDQTHDILDNTRDIEEIHADEQPLGNLGDIEEQSHHRIVEQPIHQVSSNSHETDDFHNHNNQQHQRHQNRNDGILVVNTTHHPTQRDNQNMYNSDSLVYQGQDGSYTIDASHLRQIRGNRDIQFYKEIDSWKYRYLYEGDKCNICLTETPNDQSLSSVSNQRTTSRSSYGNSATTTNARRSRNYRPFLNPYQNDALLRDDGNQPSPSGFSMKQVAMIFPQMDEDKYMSGMNSLVILEAQGLLVALDLKNSLFKTFLLCSSRGSRPNVRRKGCLNLSESQPLSACKFDESKVAVARVGSKLTIVKCVRNRNLPQIEYEFNTKVQYSGLAHVNANSIACSCYSQGRIDILTFRDEELDTLIIVENKLEKPEVLSFSPRTNTIVFLTRGAEGATLVGLDGVSKEILFRNVIESNLDHDWCIARFRDAIVLCCTNTNQVSKFSPDGDYVGKIDFPAHALDRPCGLVFDAKGMLFVANEGVHNKGVPPYTKPDIRAFLFS